ncbi:cadmium/peroxide/UV radiation responsive anti-sigma factor ChrR [Phenylobacterium soli]|uniref:Transcriptional regulator n=1 Tax=Phenylobacterium soli TaxID=2170551 RepID=A0A328AIW6_9CAUL|nr:ChrR family anti-sigma-E factor [Phenylobacterium soli]RAK54457.1 transcriptional regulator [Phenylobacterium soli]
MTPVQTSLAPTLAGHGPSAERLLAYATGTLSPPEAVVVATHLALRPQADGLVRGLMSVGGEVLESLAPTAMAADALDVALARVEADSGEAAAPPPLNDMPELPGPLRRYPLGRWRWMGPGVRVRDVGAPRDGACRVILLKIDPGRSTPLHTHGGVELTCVLSGAYATETARFDVGDLEEADGEVLHQPRVVSHEPCLCVAALDGQLLLPGVLGRLMQPFIRL